MNTEVKVALSNAIVINKEEVIYLILKAPAISNIKNVFKLKQIVLRALIEASKASDSTQDSKDADDTGLTSDAIIMALCIADVNTDKVLDLFNDMLTGVGGRACGFLEDGKTPLNKINMRDLTADDGLKLFGEYCINFLGLSQT